MTRLCEMCRTTFEPRNSRHFKCPTCGAHFTYVMCGAFDGPKSIDACILKAGHDGRHSSGRRTWR